MAPRSNPAISVQSDPLDECVEIWDDESGDAVCLATDLTPEQVGVVSNMVQDFFGELDKVVAAWNEEENE